MKNKYGLWTASYSPNVLGFKIRTNVSPDELECSLLEEQENCHHEMQRFGPSYVPRRDGSYRKLDESICMKCGYQPKGN